MQSVLSVESKIDVGSRFYFTVTFPVVESTQLNQCLVVKTNVADSAATYINCLQQVNILLVDDDELNLFIGQQLLREQGANVVLAQSGALALQQLEQQTFDLIFMDINMPDMNGYEVTQQIRSLTDYQHVPIVALTAHALESVRERALKVGMNDYLVKPFVVNELYRVAVACLGKSK